MLKLLNSGLITGWKGYVAAALIAAAVAGVSSWKVNGWRYEARLARAEATHSQMLEQIAEATVLSVQAARAEEQRLAIELEKQRDHSRKQTEALTADLAAGRTASNRLRKELDALRARYASIDTGASGRGEGQQGADPIGVLIDLYAGLDQSGREVTEYADRLRIAGLTCEQASDAVRGQ